MKNAIFHYKNYAKYIRIQHKCTWKEVGRKERRRLRGLWSEKERGGGKGRRQKGERTGNSEGIQIKSKGRKGNNRREEGE